MLLVTVALLGGCGDSSPSSSPPGSPSSTSGATRAPAASPVAPSATASATPATSLTVLVPGALAETVTDGLRVRSQPAVAASSVKYTPLLPKGTQLVIAAGPVEASGYTWFKVAPMDVRLAGNVDQGWVAVADHDGTPWVALADDPTPGFELAAGALDRSAASLPAAKAEAKAVNAFGIALYKRIVNDPLIVEKGKGMVFSPQSIVTALAMARAGAKGSTATEMDRVLQVKGWAPLASGLSSLDQLLRSRDATWKDQYEEGGPHALALRTANMAFAQRGYALEPTYLDRLGRQFGSGLGLVDFIHRTEAARQAINGWVSRQTMGRIPELLAPPALTEAARLVLVNATYLKAEWARPFDAPGVTTDRAFTTARGEVRTVPTMELTGEQDVVLATGTGWRATELRYAGPGETSPLAMTIIVPDSLASFERSLSPKILTAIQSRIASERKRIETATYSGVEDCGTYPYNVHLFMPRFGVETSAGLNKVLAALGMPTAFDSGKADFSGMTTQDRLHIGFVIHQANIDVDENGTEAAAATAVGMDTGGCTGPAPAKTRTLRLDKPFIFAIRDVQTGAILFMGRVTDPSTP